MFARSIRAPSSNGRRIIADVKNTTQIGDTSKAMIMAALLKAKRTVLVPFGDGLRYDLVVDEGPRFSRIQCKTGRLNKRGVIEFNLYSVHRENGRFVNRPYENDVDAYGVYCAATNECYLVPAAEVGIKGGYLRVTPFAPGGRSYSCKFAKDYVIRA